MRLNNSILTEVMSSITDSEIQRVIYFTQFCRIVLNN
jgi:hypothetical protein